MPIQWAEYFPIFSLLDQAAATYELAMQLDPERDYNSQLAKIYGRAGKARQDV